MHVIRQQTNIELEEMIVTCDFKRSQTLKIFLRQDILEILLRKSSTASDRIKQFVRFYFFQAVPQSKEYTPDKSKLDDCYVEQLMKIYMENKMESGVKELVNNLCAVIRKVAKPRVYTVFY